MQRAKTCASVSGTEQAVALVIVLAFVVLLTVAVVAFFSRATTERQVSNNSAKAGSADALALSALEMITGDLKQEISDGSTTSGSPPIYQPSTVANMVPQRSGTPSSAGTLIPNLVRVSIQDNGPSGANPMPIPGIPSRASNSSSTAPSLNGRAVSLARWNSHYLIPRATTSSTIDSSPVTSFTPPDWVLVTRAGPTLETGIGSGGGALSNSTPTNSAFVVGRYAYAVYDEGGLIDVNVAGVPSNSTLFQFGRKGSLAFADLTASSGPSLSQSPQIDDIVGWRNYASIGRQNNTPPSGTLLSDYTFTSANAADYFTFVRARTDGSMTVNPQPYPSSAGPSSRTDQIFVTRQDLLRYRRLTGFSQNALEFLGTFSREGEANVPQWSPATPDATNPDFKTLKVTSTFSRNDGTTAKAGEPLVKQRFLLQRLNWLTYKGPSASRTLTDTDIALLTANYGISPTFLAQGTDANIANYFGLAWDAANERWNYLGHSGVLATFIAPLSSLTGTREPDFFELLQAGIINASIGDSVASDPALPITHQQSKMLHLLTIGANVIAQARTDSYPTRIAFNNSGTTMEAIGSPRLPYLNSLAVCPVAGTGTTGGINWFLVPNLWNPFRDNWDLTEANVSSTLTPGYPRPPVRITVVGSADFGTVTSSPSLQSGSVPSGVTAFLTPVSGINSSLILKTGATSGRDGLADASRLATSDFPASPLAFTTTTSPTTAGFAWNSITRPARPNGTVPGTANFVVFRLSLPGASIPSSTINPAQNPVLILKPGFQMTMDYQSPNGIWYPYSYLQGINATNTWISADLNLTTTFSQYGLNTAPPSTSPTILASSAATAWNLTTLAQAPMLGKADPRSIRYNTQIGVLNVSGALPAPTPSAGIIDSIWPAGYPTPPPMSPGSNPASYSQSVGDNGLAATNPYDESISTSASVRPIIMNRPFRSVGEMSYAFRDRPFKTIDFSTAASPDAGLLDLFTVNEYTHPSGARAGAVNLNSRQPGALAAVLKNTIRREDTPRVLASGAPSPQPSPVADTQAKDIAASIVTLTSTTPVANRAALTTLIANQTGLGVSIQKTQRESIARGLGDVGQTRTWNLMIDVIAQSGRYPPTATNMSQFVVEGEKRYWLHVAIDRFTGEIVDQQLEAVYE
jgi:hypothetical protein